HRVSVQSVFVRGFPQPLMKTPARLRPSACGFQPGLPSDFVPSTNKGGLVVLSASRETRTVLPMQKALPIGLCNQMVYRWVHDQQVCGRVRDKGVRMSSSLRAKNRVR